MSSALDILSGYWNRGDGVLTFLLDSNGAPSKPIPNGVDRYGRIEECEDLHAMIEIDPEKHAQQTCDLEVH